MDFLYFYSWVCLLIYVCKQRHNKCYWFSTLARFTGGCLFFYRFYSICVYYLIISRYFQDLKTYTNSEFLWYDSVYSVYVLSFIIMRLMSFIDLIYLNIYDFYLIFNGTRFPPSLSLDSELLMSQRPHYFVKTSITTTNMLSHSYWLRWLNMWLHRFYRLKDDIYNILLNFYEKFLS